MVFGRNKKITDNKTTTKLTPFLAKETKSKMEILYMSIMCFVANCLSSVALEAGTRFPLGQSSATRSGAFNALFRRSYNLKIKILATNVISGMIATLMVAFGDKYGIPYLYVPWLVNTIQGMALCEGPALLSLAHVLLPVAGFSAGSFLFITLLLYVEELCLWNNVFASFRQCWTEYNNRKRQAVALTNENSTMKSKREEGHHEGQEQNMKFDLSKPSIREQSTEFYDEPRRVRSASPVSSVTSVSLRFMKNIVDGRNRSGRSRFTRVTG